MIRRIDPLVVVAGWLVLFGVWPLADPKHTGDTPASMLDLALHIAGVAFFVLRAWVRWQAAPERQTDYHTARRKDQP